MDPSENLVSVLQSRTDGYWQLLATAAGREEAVAACMAGLTATALDANFDGLAVSPSIVQRRVDALAAFDAGLLVQISGSWKRPGQVSLDLLNGKADFWTTAWYAALRFLKRQGAPLPIDADPVPRPIHIEQQILSEPSARVLGSVDELITFVLEGSDRYEDYRRLDAAVVQTRDVLTEQALLQLIDGSLESDGSKLERLRVLIPRPHLVGSVAKDCLKELLRARWFKLSKPPEEWGGLLVLLNLVMVLEPKPLPDIEDHFIEVLRRGESPADWAPFAYLLLRQGWVVP